MTQTPRPKKLMIAIAAGLSGSTLLVGCADEQVDATIFADIPACIAAGQEPLACENAFQTAGTEHAKSAPRFTSLADCEAEFSAGACGSADKAGIEENEPRQAGGSFFYPLMAGYLMGSVLRGAGQPLYRSRDGNWRNTSGNNLGKKSGGVSVAKSAATTRPSARTTVTSRGGFTAPRASRSFGG